MKLSCLAASFFLLTLVRANEHHEQDVLDYLLSPERYDSRIMPNASHGDKPLAVQVNMYILDVAQVDDLNQDFSVSFYFRQFWNDYRLRFEDRSWAPSLRLMEVDKIWKPDVFFVSEKKGRLHDITLPNAFIRIFPNGSLIYSCRVSLKLTCLMDLRYYPLDMQTCIIPVESYGYTAQRLDLQWKEPSGSVGIGKEVSDWQFVVKTIDTEYHRVEMSTGKYVTLKAKLVLRRNIGYYISQLYVPFIILVMVSWLSFWLDQNAVALRLGLTLTILAMMCLQTAGMNANSPKVSYTRAADVWMAVCSSFVFASLLEFIWVNQLARREFKQWKTEQKEEKKGSKEVSMDGGYVSDSKVLLRYLRKYNSPSKRIDVVSRFVFPIFFVFFNLIYWTIYSSGAIEDSH